MQIFNEPDGFQQHNERLRCSGAKLGLFATLGAVHRGHLSLVERARAENDTVVSSVFVNPLMFTTEAEAAAYPSDLAGDLEKLERAGVDAVITPSREAIYPPGYTTHVTMPAFEGRFESARLPNMVTGIATICTKLFQMCVPHKWYFGEKDAEQLALVKRLAQDLQWPCEIVPCPGVREADGLPFSSRNVLLSADERRAAVCVVEAIKAAKEEFDVGWSRASHLTEAATTKIAREPGAGLEYIAIVDRDTFDEQDTAAGNSLLIVAIKVGAIRILDNHPLGAPLPMELRSSAPA